MVLAIIPISIGTPATAATLSGPLAISAPVALFNSEWDYFEGAVAVPSSGATSYGVEVAWFGMAKDQFVLKEATLRNLWTEWNVNQIFAGLDRARAGCCAAPSVSSFANRTLVVYGTPEFDLQVLTKGSEGQAYVPGAKFSQGAGGFAVLAVNASAVLFATVENGSIQLRFSEDGGATVSNKTDVSRAGSGVSGVRMAHDGNGTAAACWADMRNGNPDIYAARIDVALREVGRPIRVDDTGLTPSAQTTPSCTFLNNRSLMVTWIDNRSGVPNDQDLFAAVSDQEFSSFSPSVRIDDASPAEISIQSSPSVAADPVGNAYLFFQDTRDFAPAVFYSVLGVENGTVVHGPNFKVNGSEVQPFAGTSSAFLVPRVSISPEGSFFLTWRGSQNVPLIATGRTIAAGGNQIPTCFLTTPGNISRTNETIHLAGWYSDGEGWPSVTGLTAFLDGTETVANRSGSAFSLAISGDQLAVGPHSISVRVTDQSGGTGICIADFRVEGAPSQNRAPTIELLRPVGSPLAKGPFTVSGSSADPDGPPPRTLLSIDGGTMTEISILADWEFEIATSTLGLGVHTMVLLAFDGELYSAPVIRTFLVQSAIPHAMPACGVSIPAPGSTIPRNGSVAGWVKDEDGIGDVFRISYSIQPLIASGDLEVRDVFLLSYKAPPSVPGIVVNVTVLDAEGRVFTCGASFKVVDALETAPSVVVTKPQEGGLVNITAEVAGSAMGEGAEITQVRLVLPGEGEEVAVGTSNWSLSWAPQGLASGVYYIIAAAVNSAGVWSQPYVVQVTFLNGTLVEGGERWLLALLSANLVTGEAVADVPAHLEARIQNYGAESADLLFLQMWVEPLVGGTGPIEVFAEKIDARPGNITIVSVNWTPRTPGVYRVSARINGDHLFPDSLVIQREADSTFSVAGPAPAVATPTPVPVALWIVAIGGLIGILAFYWWRKSRD